MTNGPADEVTTAEALEIAGFAHPSSITRLVAEHKLTPTRKLPGKTGAYLFLRSDIEALAAARAAVAS